MIYIKKHDSENGNIIAMCDSSLIDKVLTEGDMEVNIRDYSDFYKGELISTEKAKDIIKTERLYSANIIGKESVALAIESSIIKKDNVKTIKKIPYALAFRVKV